MSDRVRPEVRDHCPRCGGIIKFDDADELYLCIEPGTCCWYDDPDDPKNEWSGEDLHCGG